jgi:hypothetical protein
MYGILYCTLFTLLLEAAVFLERFNAPSMFRILKLVEQILPKQNDGKTQIALED